MPQVAYIVLAHSDPRQFKRLIDRLNDPRVLFVVHIDAKAPLAPFQEAAAGLPNVVFVKDRVRVVWAAFSQVESTLRAFETALDHTDETCTHFVVLSGADYPIASNDRIIATLTSQPHKQFIRRFDILKCGDRRQMQRVRGWHLRELADRNTWQRKPLYAIEAVMGIVPKRIPRDLVFASGSNWIALTRACASYCTQFSADHPSYKRMFRFSFATDEIYFHTLVQNSQFAEEAGPVESYLDVTALGGPWKYGNLHYLHPIVDIKTADEAQEILKDHQDMLFARKFSSKNSQEALTYIDRHLDARAPGA